jgi:aspartyl-tRNA(Asn)/glutamyl-tRNA(Gln) amidotransferase subunit A
VVPLSSSFDTPGPMTRSVRDAALLLGALLAETGSSAPNDWAALDDSVAGLRVGVSRRNFFDDLQPEVAACVEEAIAVIKTLVVQVADVELEAGGHRSIFNAEIYEYHQAMATETPELYQPQTLPRIVKCAGISATDYIRDWRSLAEERNTAEELFQQVDVVVTPTVPVAAPRISQLQSLGINELRSFETRYLLRNTSPFSVLYWPSVSVPCGFTREELPVGLQISGKPGTDATVLRLAHAYEQATQWHKRVPSE